MAPKSVDPDWIPSTSERKACGNRPTRRKSDAPFESKAKASLCVHQPPPKKGRGMRKRRAFNELAGLITVVPGCLNLSWMKKKRSNTPIRRRNMSTFAAVVRVHHETVQNNDVEEDIIGDGATDSPVDAGVEEIISLGDSLELQPPLKVYKRCENRRVFNWDDATVSNSDKQSMEEKDDCDSIITPMIPETQVDEATASSSFTILAPRSMEEEDDCDDGMNSSVIPETQVMQDEGTAVETDECTDRVNNVDFKSEANVMLAELEKNNIPCVPLTPQVQEKGKHGNSEEDSSNCEIGHSSRQDCFIPSTYSASSKDGQVESLIDILKKRNENGADKTPNKKRKKKRHNPKVVDPNISTPKPQTPKHVERVKKKINLSKPSTLQPRTRTPKLAKQVIAKADSLEDENGEARCKRKRVSRRKLNFDGEAQERKLNFDGEPQDRLSELKSQLIIRKKRSVRKRVSLVKLNSLITSTREMIPSAYIRARSKLDRKGLRIKRVKAVISAYFGTPTSVLQKSVQKVLQRKSAGQVKIPYHSPVNNTIIQQDSVLLIQDEPFFKAVEDFLTKKMESLNIADDSGSSALVLSGKKKIHKKGPKPDVKLDEETMKVWDLLMTSNWSEDAEAEALGNDEYMKGQRKLFRERLERFISRMRVVQGKMEFKPWKGSVLDSIVGVFLTQNVSDNFSSSAFMTLRARYPPLSLSEQNTLYCRGDEQVMSIEPSNIEEHNPMIQEDPQVLPVEPSNTTSGGKNPKIQVEIGNEFDHEPEAPEATKGSKKGNGRKKKEKEIVDWDSLRKQYSQGISKERTEHNADSVNWEAIRQASEAELASVIHKRGMNNQLAGRIKCFLDRMVRDHGSLDLEWLRHVPPLKAKDFLMSINGLALKSTECVRLLALHFPAFPVDTNAGRFFVRMGWVPLKPLPEDVQLHLLNSYPVLDSIQKYIWPRVCDNGHPLLYEAHCHTITFAKSFCTMKKPNCNECPMRDECNHFASAHASAKLRLEGPQPENVGNPSTMSSQEAPMVTSVDGNESGDHHTSRNSEPIIEFPPSPVAEPVPMEPLDGDIEDIGRDSEITTIRLNGREFSKNLHTFVNEDDEVLKALVPLDPRLGSVPIPKHKVAIGLRTVHQVYELPDSHPLLHTFDQREPEDPCPYFLAIWTADEKEAAPCDAGTMCLSGEVARYQKHGTVKGTILIPCLTANKGAFPLNGTYFQPHEVFADRESSRQPIDVPRYLIWNLNRRFLYCGTSLASICRGMSIQEVAYSFRKSVICIREFDRKTGFPTTLASRFHLCKSRPVDKM